MKNRYRIQDLISNNKEIYNSNQEDFDLRNAWDMVIVNDTMWVSATRSGKLIQYTLDGKKIVSFDMPNFESPTGLALNVRTDPTSDILYIVTKQGKLYAFNPSLLNPIRLLIDNSNNNASYTGLIKCFNLLYATDFNNKEIDVFDSLQNFAIVNLSFIDQNISDPLPANYSPFNIFNINSRYLFILYAEKNDNSNEVIIGDGKGYINIYTLAGNFIQRFTSRGYLNAPSGFMIKNHRKKDSVIVANFGDGKINEYSINGQFVRTLTESCKKEIQIDGLRNLVSNEVVYFTAAPNGGNDGLIGKIVK